MTIKEIIRNYLKEHGYDGLVLVDCECGCPIDDLFVCENPHADCEPACLRHCCDCAISTCEIRGCGECLHPDKLKGGGQ